jgi:hypothetical protein
MPINADCGILVEDNAVDAQTERSGTARPVNALLGGENSPAAFFPCQRFDVVCSFADRKGNS